MKQLPKHPNVVTLRDTYEDDEAVHIVMELCEGGELFDRIVARGHYTERAAASIMKTIVEVVQATNVPLGEIVKSRLKQFSVMNKLKKQALRVCLQKLGHQVNDVDLQNLMESADVNRDGTLDCGEFVVVTLHLKRMANDEHLHKAFAFFDKNQTGYIEVEELRQVLSDEGEITNEEDGRISYEEFVVMMRTGTDWRKASRQYSRERFNNLSLKLMNDGSLELTSSNR
ncbi:hypothetical protein M8C21_021766 [Ambrosia artemisiifolia]|uniref:Uncharacterized protein n=1 Tax=Ambrosia artemisiifolia TaxID=4212 RepID=A0AAD5GTL5_AMBAR|nr:hypothetical protein M8C21_021766 [Ambrosia artemisiifolia]